MRHRKKGKKLNRNANQRKALFRNLINSFILKEEIKTTEAKAKAIKGLIDKIINKAKKGKLSARRQLLAFLANGKVVNKLVDQLSHRLKNRKSGYTRIIRLKRRRGDNSLIVKLELVDKEIGKEKQIESGKKEKKEKDKKE